MRCKKRLGLYAPRQFGPADLWQDLLRHLRETLGPSRLLHLKAVHLDGKLRGALKPRQIYESPSLELRAIAQVGILGQRIGLPAAGIVDHAAPQNARRPVEVEEVAGCRSRPVLEDEMPIEQHGFHFGQEVVIAIQIAPARLHHAHLGVNEVGNGLDQKIRRRNKIGVEDGNKFAGCGLEALRQRAGFEPLPVVAVMVLDGETEHAVALAQGFRIRVRVIGGIVQHLNLQQFLRILDFGDFVDQPFDDVPFVVNGQLNGDARKLLKARHRLFRGVLPVLEVGSDDVVTVQPVNGKNRQHAKVRNEQGIIEPARTDGCP